MRVQQNGNAIKSEKKQRKSQEADVAAHFHITEGLRFQSRHIISTSTCSFPPKAETDGAQ